MAPAVWMLDEEWPEHGFEQQFFLDRGVEFRASTETTLNSDWRQFGVGATALIAQVGFPLSTDLLEQLRQVRGIVVPGVGYDHIDLAWARAHGMSVSHIPDYCTEEVAEHTLALILFYLRNLGLMDREVREGTWQPLRYLNNRRAQESVIGLVGLGRIGGRVTQKARSLGFRVLAYDPYVGSDYMKGLGVEGTSLELLMAQSDYVSIHVPLTKETRGMISSQRLSLMKPTAVFLNTARSNVVDQMALFGLLESGRIRGAGLDVFDEEPLPFRSQWLALPNVLLTPHAAYVTSGAVNELRRKTCEEALRIINGEAIRHPVS